MVSVAEKVVDPAAAAEIGPTSTATVPASSSGPIRSDMPPVRADYPMLTSHDSPAHSSETGMSGTFSGDTWGVKAVVSALQLARQYCVVAASHVNPQLTVSRSDGCRREAVRATTASCRQRRRARMKPETSMKTEAIVATYNTGAIASQSHAYPSPREPGWMVRSAR